VIVRIVGEGQYRMPEAAFAALNAIDHQLETAAAAGDEAAFHAALEQLAAAVRAHGQELPPEELTPSDAVLPGPDVTLEEARELLGEEGLIPG
jgi:hypothetical protein